MVNKAIIIGNLGRAPRISAGQSGVIVANLSIATSEKYKDTNGQSQEKTEWHRIVAFGRLAEICERYLDKGDRVYVTGRLQTRQWVDSEGSKRYTTEIIAKEIKMLGGGSSSATAHHQEEVSKHDSLSGSKTSSIIEEPLPF